jgi:hypothetical protein
MKTRLLPTALGIVGFAAVVGLFGHSLRLDAEPATTPPSQASTWEKEKSALLQAHSRDITKFTISLDAATEQVSMLRTANATLTAEKKAACDRLAKAGITIPECR